MPPKCLQTNCSKSKLEKIIQKYFLIVVRLEGRIDHLFIPRNAKAPDLDTATRVARYRKISRPSALSRRNELSSVLEPVG